MSIPDRRLIAFGCSNTVGEWLPGWQPGIKANNWVPTFSDDCWPFVLARLFHISNVQNAARGGDGNHEILLKLLITDFKPGDIAAICWTYAGREILFHEEGKISQTMWMRNSERFYAAHDIVDLELRTQEYIHHAELYLKSIGVEYVMATPEYFMGNHQHKHTVKFSSIQDLVPYEFIDFAHDNSHPGLQSHQRLAERLYDRYKLNYPLKVSAQ
jgi:hypothetical protein